MIRSVREPSSLTSQRPPPQTPLAMNGRPHRGTGLDPGPAPGQARYRREERPGHLLVRLRPEHRQHQRRITIR